MTKYTFITVIITILLIPLKRGFAQTNPCPSNNEYAEKAVKKSLSDVNSRANLTRILGITISDTTLSSFNPLTEKAEAEICEKLFNTDKLSKKNKYSFYEFEDHYYVVDYSYNQEGRFEWDYMPVFNNEYDFLGVIMNTRLSVK